MNKLCKILVCFLLLIASQSIYAENNSDPQSGLIIDEGFTTVKQQCSLCHSLQLITQNKANYQGWLKTIRWMQKKQGMQQLNTATEKIILSYLAKNYAPKKTGRRTLLMVNKWQPFKKMVIKKPGKV